MRRLRSPKIRIRAGWYAALLGTVASLPLLTATPGVAQNSTRHDTGEGATLRMLTFNIWNRFKQNPDAPAQLLIPGNYDAVLFQEESGSRYVTDLPGILKNAGLGDYQGARNGSSGVISRLPGSVGTHVLGGDGAQGRNLTYAVAAGADGRPDTMIGSIHMDYSDDSLRRIEEARALSAWANQIGGPLIMGGDFNAGDVAERGLHDIEAQIKLLRNVGNNDFYRKLAWQYINAGDEAAMRGVIQDAYPGQDIDSLSWRQWGDALATAHEQGRDVGLQDETYPVLSNTPVTMNILKKQFMMFQTEEVRERFAPHERGDGSTTWPSYGEDSTNTWASWDRSKIDHFLVSRPYGKWFVLTDDPADEYLGVVDKIYVDRGDGSTAPLSDHDLVGHEFTWVGPKLEAYATDGGTAIRLGWGEGASTFSAESKEFFLTRNNMRTDVYLGQIADDNGVPILTDLTLEEKKTLLDCSSGDPRFQAAIVDYCIDDHSFIGEVLISDGGTLIVDEDAALGTSDATLRLSEGGLRIAGNQMGELGRNVSLEGAGGFVEIASANALVTASGVISGDGAFTKSGEGALVLAGNNTYTGDTTVRAGLLVVNGSIETSALTTVADGAALGGSGSTGALTVSSGGTLAAGNSIGTLTVRGDLTFAAGSIFAVEANAEGEADHVAVTGVANLNGSVFALTPDGAWRPRTSYTILSAAGGLNGRFGSVTSSLAFLDASLSYGATDVALNLERNDTAFDSVALRANGRAAATGIESLGMGNAVYDAVVMTDAKTANAAFDSLSGEVHASTMAAQIANALVLGDVLHARMGSFGKGPELTQGSAGNSGMANTWVRAYGGWGENEEGDFAKIRRNTAGTLFGADFDTTPNWRIGGFAGFGSGAVKSQDARIEVDSYHLGIYGATISGPLGLRFGVAHSVNDHDSSRDVTYGSLSETLKAGYDGQVTQILGEASWLIDTANGSLQPFGGLTQIHASTDAFSESGTAGLSANSTSMDATFVTLGLRAEQVFAIGGTPALFQGEIGWRRGFGDLDPKANMAFAGGTEFGIAGLPVAEDMLVLKAGLGAALSDTANVSFGYAGKYGDDAKDHSLTAKLDVRF